MKILNLYAGIGGNRKLWGNGHEITAIEYEQEIADIYKGLFPQDTVIVTDAHQYLLEHFKEFDFIWASPPCPTHSRMSISFGINNVKRPPKYPNMELYQEIIFLKHFAKKNTKWVVENVIPYYEPLIKPQVALNRHYFWTNFYVQKRGFKEENKNIRDQSTEDRYGFSLKNTKINKDKKVVLRNLVNPEIGLYLFEQAQKGKKPLFNFNY